MFLLAALSIFGCTRPRTPPPGANMLAIGDSIFEAHRSRGRSIPDVVAERTGHTVHNAAEGGAWVTGGSVTSIEDQRIDGDFAWLVMNGGGNDVNGRCGCGDCDAILDELVSADASTGHIVRLVQDAVDKGMRVAFMSYPELPEGARFGFDRCDEELVEHRRRLAALAARVPGMWFVDATEVITATDLAYFVDDRVHPTIEGSRIMGEHIAETLLRVKGEPPPG